MFINIDFNETIPKISFDGLDYYIIDEKCVVKKYKNKYSIISFKDFIDILEIAETPQNIIDDLIKEVKK